MGSFPAPQSYGLVCGCDPQFPLSCAFRKQTSNQIVIVSFCVDFSLRGLPWQLGSWLLEGWRDLDVDVRPAV